MVNPVNSYSNIQPDVPGSPDKKIQLQGFLVGTTVGGMPTYTIYDLDSQVLYRNVYFPDDVEIRGQPHDSGVQNIIGHMDGNTFVIDKVTNIGRSP